MTRVIDASVAAKWSILEVHSDHAHRLIEAGDDLIAPDFLLVEVANTLFKAWTRGAIDAAHMDEALTLLPSAFSRLWPTGELVADAGVIARALRHPVYDCLYLALSERTGSRIVTADERFLRVSIGTPWDGFLIHVEDAS